MVVNMMKWRMPWPPPLSRRVEAVIVVRCLKLGFQMTIDDDDDDDGGADRDDDGKKKKRMKKKKTMMREGGGGRDGKLVVEVRWKGPASSSTKVKGSGLMAGLGRRKEIMRKNYTREEGFTLHLDDDDDDDGQSDGGVVADTIHWDEEFRAFCTFSHSRYDNNNNIINIKDNEAPAAASFHPWEVEFFVFHGLSERLKSRALFAGPAILNLAEYGFMIRDDGKPLEINLPFRLPTGDANCCPTLCLSLNLTELRVAPQAPESVPRPLIPVSLSPCFRAPQTTEKNDNSYALKASSKRFKILTDVISSRKARSPSPGEVSSDGKCSTGTGSEDSWYTYPFDSDSLDGTDEDDSEEIKANDKVRKIVGYGTLVSANLARGAFGTRHYGEDEEELYYSNNKLEVCCEDNDQESAVAASDQSLIRSPKRRILSWRKKKKGPKQNKGEPLLKKEYSEVGGDDIDFDRWQLSSSDESFLRELKSKEDLTTPVSEFGDDNFTVGSWEWKEVVSRDGSMKLRAPVFFASIDQRHEKAAGESACTALVTVIANHLLENCGEIPIKSELDSLIREGSLQWRNLCENESYLEQFPDKHFDLETVLQAKVRPLFVEPEKSFVGFFHPEGIEERFEFLHGAMSFDGVWDEICQIQSDCCNGGDPLVYIVSWNDHFFVLMVDSDAFYIIDTLGERLFEGCREAYVLKFDKGSMIIKMPPKNEEAANADNSQREKEKLGANEVSPPQGSAAGSLDTSAGDAILDEGKHTVVCSGKESCKEYINCFLAAIPIRELQADIKRGLMSSTPLHHRLQIEFHHMQFSSPAVAKSTIPEVGEATVEPATSF